MVESRHPTDEPFLAGDSLRGLACVAVFVFHASFGAAMQDGFNASVTGDTRASLGGAFGRADPILEFLPIAVYVFFSLSGYLLSRRFIRAYVEGTPAPSARNFVRNRALRIIPAFWFVFALGVVRYGTNGSTTEELLAIPLFLQVYIHGPATDVIAHAWTIDTEWALYLGLPLVAVCLGRPTAGRIGRRGRLAVVASTIAAVYVASLAFRAFGPVDTYYQRSFWAASWAFLPGVALAFFEVGWAERLRGARWGRAAAVAATLGWVLLAAAYTATPDEALGRHALLTTLATLLIVGGPLLLQWTRGEAWRLLTSRPCRWIGERSYSFYLLHFLIGVHVAEALAFDEARRGLLISAPLAFGATCLAAAFSYRYVEVPFLARKASHEPGDDLVPSRTVPAP